MDFVGYIFLTFMGGALLMGMWLNVEIAFNEDSQQVFPLAKRIIRWCRRVTQ